MVRFQCKRSGNFVSFTNENDIAGLRRHEGYIEVKEKHEEVIEKQEAPKKEVLIPEFSKQRGRPKKNSI